jgi:hypothetical protein
MSPPITNWEAASRTATQEFSNILCNPKVYFLVRKSSPLVPILSHRNPVRSTYFILILSSHLRQVLPSGLFPLGFSTKILYEFLPLFHPCYMWCISHHPLLDHSNYTWRRVQVMKFLMQLSPTSCHFILLECKYSLQHPFLIYSLSMFLL